MSYDYIDRVVGLFFKPTGILRYMKGGESFRIPGFGTFKITRKEKLKRERDAERAKERRRLSHNRKIRKYNKKYRRKLAWKRYNKKRIERGVEPVDFDTFAMIPRNKNRYKR